MKPVTRHDIFAQAAKKLRADFNELSVVPHAALKGGQAEALVRAFLRAHLPKRFTAGSGFIIDARDQISKQTDVIIYDALNCPVYRASDEAAIIPADNVAAVVEVKSRLDKESLREAFENCTAVKGLAKTKRDDRPGLSLSQTFFAIFAFDTPLNVRTMADHYRNMVAEFGLGRHIDLIMVLDKCVHNLTVRIPGVGTGWSPAFFEGIPPTAEGTHLGIGSMTPGENSLDVFLRFLMPQLIFFREITGHPGFDWKSVGAEEGMITYLTSITMEKDEGRRAEKLKEYERQVIAEFEKAKKP